MRTAYQDIIRSQSIEISFENTDEGIGMQNHIAEVFYEKLKPSMERVVQEEIGDNYFAFADRLEIDCGILSNKNWEEAWVETTIRKLRDELRRINKKRISVREPDPAKPTGETYSLSENATASFLFFLVHGHLPWNSRIRSINEMEELIQIDKLFIEKLKEMFQQHEKAKERLAVQFSDQFRQRIITALIGDKDNQFREISSLLKGVKSLIEKKLIDTALFHSFSAPGEDDVVQRFFAFIHDKAGDDQKPGLLKLSVQAGIKSPGGKKEEPAPYKNKTENNEEAIYISNAGLIILHPFLPEFFETLKLTGKNEWINDQASHQAALITGLLVTGTEEFFEFDMMLNKLLCGIDTNEVLQCELKIEDHVYEACDSLLNAVIKHWPVLKNTGIDALRETFLQRNGKLVRVDDGWHLQVEQKGLDVLLSHLPWGIGTIKLPWMKEVLYTEW